MGPVSSTTSGPSHFPVCFVLVSLKISLLVRVIFGRDLLKKEARDERLDHMVALVLAALTGKSTAAFGENKPVKLRSPAHHTA